MGGKRSSPATQIMTAITSSLTDKELALYSAIANGMDSAGNGWLSQLTPFENEHVTAGVLGSLISKGLVVSNEDDEPVAGYLPDYWVSLV